MNSASSHTRPQVRHIGARCTHPLVVKAFIAALLIVASMAATSAAAHASAEPTSAPAAPSPAAPTPTEHSYDDAHSGQQPEGVSPALWILGGAIAALIAIGVVLQRAGEPARHDPKRSG